MKRIDDYSIHDEDYKTIARMLPQQTAKILGINPINNSTPRTDALKQAQKEAQPQIDTQPLSQIQEQQTIQPTEQNAIPPISQNIESDVENIVNQIRSGAFTTGNELSANRQAVLDLLQPAQDAVEASTQDGLSAAAKVAQANAAIANFRAQEEARAQQEQPAPTVRKYHFNGTTQTETIPTENTQTGETAPVASQDENISQMQSKRQPRPMREMYDNTKSVFKNFKDASDAIIAGYEGGYVGRDEAEEMLRQGHLELGANLTTKKNTKAYNKLLDSTIARLNNATPQAQNAEQTAPTVNESETAGANRANSIKEYYEERKAEYRLMELDELTARRRRYINERIKHYNDNQGGRGTNTTLLDADGNTVSGADIINARKRVTESNNPQWYQKAYALLGRKPAKKDYEYIAETDLSEWQPDEVQADWRALNEVIEEKKNEEQIKAEPKNVQNFRKAVNQKVRDYKKGIKSVKDKEASRTKYLNAIKDMRDKALRVAAQDETKAAMEEAYNNAVGEITRAYDEVTAKNTQNSAQAESAQNELITSQKEKTEVTGDNVNSTDEISQDSWEYHEKLRHMIADGTARVKTSESVENFIKEHHKDDASTIREILYEPTINWNKAEQKHEIISIAQVFEEFAKTPGARIDYVFPENNGLGGETGELVYLNDEMEYARGLNPQCFDYLKYLLDKKDNAVEDTAQDNSAQTKKAANEGGQENEGEASNTESNETDKGGVVVTGNEFGEYKDIKELRAKAREYYKENLQGTSVENPILGEVNLTDHSIDFTKRGIDKAISTSAKENKLLLVKYLPELIKNATRVSARGNKKTKRDASQYTYLYTTAKISGKEQPVEITIFTDVNGNRYYNHILPLEENNKRSLPVYPAQASKSGDGIPAVSQQTPSFDSTIPQTEPTGKDKNSTKQETTQQERSQNEDAFSDGKLNQDTRGIYDTTNIMC